ncbi:hypothetical protein [Nocardia cyriacigeorgica]|uniref:Uncharacterized protein n=1 Tax=Nocardia cyriacigeorgica TaxID=135487 RepID=A0A5R8NBD0_9NOCA|nr:hypothetical protein [Nocardia cyriacigeorgica]TLF72936.1 hypothetical protein FEK34_28355 [Nocardia cyriacigeorgica]
MKIFETRFGAGKGMEEVRIDPVQERLWAAAFGVETLDGMFDLVTAAEAIPRFDEAIDRFNHEPDLLRPLLDPSDFRGLRGNRRVLEQMRATLADHPDATISGMVED